MAGATTQSGPGDGSKRKKKKKKQSDVSVAGSSEESESARRGHEHSREVVSAAAGRSWQELVLLVLLVLLADLVVQGDTSASASPGAGKHRNLSSCGFGRRLRARRGGA